MIGRILALPLMRLVSGIAGLALLAMAPAAAAPRFQHVIIMMQETRTPDNLFGSNPDFEPGVDIKTRGLNSLGQSIKLQPLPLANCYDLRRSHTYWELMYDGGKMDGANLDPVKPHPKCPPPPNPQYTYVDNTTGIVKPYFDIGRNYGFANRMFHSNQGMSFPAHQFLFGGSSAPSEASPLFVSENGSVGNLFTNGGCTAPLSFRVKTIDPKGSEETEIYPCLERETLADLLEAAGLSWKYYSLSTDSMWTAPNAIRTICDPQTVNGKQVCVGKRFKEHVSVPSAQILSDIAGCNLAAMNWVMPSVLASDHIGSNGGLGPQWVASVVNAIGSAPSCAGQKPYWQNTAILITWSEWGGWYDHVPPYRIGQRGGWGASYVYGFRVPLLVVSAYTPAGYVDNTPSDFGTLLRFVERNFGLPTIGRGTYADAYPVHPLAGFFTLTAPRAFVPIATTLQASDFINAKPESPADFDAAD